MNKNPAFVINPNFRLQSGYLSVIWVGIDRFTWINEAGKCSGNRIVCQNAGNSIFVCREQSCLYFIYAEMSDWGNIRLQKWLRERIKEFVLDVAKEVLPGRLYLWAQKHQLPVAGVAVRKLRKGVLGQCCTDSRIIYLSPMILLLPEAYTDSVILHELAHLRYPNHRKAFWDYLTRLLGEDARAQKVRMDLLMSRFYAYSDFLLK